jgi:hypothetical protein
MIFYFLLMFIIPWASNQYYYLFPAAKENKKPQKSIYFVTVLAAFRLQGPVIASKNSAKINLPFVSFRP